MKRVMLWCVVILLSLSVHAATQPQTGDYLDFTLKDGRVFKNAEVIRADQYSVFIKTGNSLTSFKLHEIRTFSPPEVITVIATETKQLQESPKQENTGAVVPTTTEEPSQASPAKNRPAVETRPLTSAQQEPEAPLNRPVQPVVSSAKVVLIGSLLALLGFGLWQMQAAKRSATANKGLKETVALYESRYSGLIDLDKAADERSKQLKDLSVSLVQRQADIEKLNADLVVLKKTLSLFDSEQDMVACGHYKLAYDFGTSEEYKVAIDENREKQREMIKSESAAVCPRELSVNGSKAEGKKATKRTLRLMLRAFNGECDAVIANVSWSNIDRMMDRLNNTFDAINKLGESYECSLAVPYRWLKEKELRLAFEYATKRQKEKDEQRDLREQMREEEKARREMEDAIKQSAADEERARAALEKARTEIGKASGEKEEALNEKIQLLEGRLKEALTNKERALSRAQQTRSGHVYIISNIGSFGDTIYKIGMTRRLDPFDRVQELSDASVPFAFDVHGMIYTEDAPSMESKLHQHFDHTRVNLVNERKEFFHATIDEIERVVKNMGATITLTKLAEAKEYRETMERRKALPAINQALREPAPTV